MKAKSTEMREKSTVFVVDTDAHNRAAVSNLVRQMNLRCIEYDLGQKFLDAYDSSWAGCLVMEVRIPDLSGLQIQRCLAQKRATLPVIFLTGYADTSIAVQAMQAGAFHFLEKPFRDHELWDAIQEAVAWDLEIRREWVVEQELEARMASLTSKELDVLEKIVDGKPNRTIAEELDVCVRTIELRRASLMGKLEVESLPELLQLVGAAIVGDSQKSDGYMQHLHIHPQRPVQSLPGRPSRRGRDGNGRKRIF